MCVLLRCTVCACVHLRVQASTFMCSSLFCMCVSSRLVDLKRMMRLLVSGAFTCFCFIHLFQFVFVYL